MVTSLHFSLHVIALVHRDVTGYPGFGDVTGYLGFGDVTGYPGFGDVTGHPGFGDVTGYPCFGDVTGCPCFGDVTAGSEKWPLSPFSETQKFCSAKFLTVKNEKF